MIKSKDRLLYVTDMGHSDNTIKYTFRLHQTLNEHIYSDFFPCPRHMQALNLTIGTLENYTVEMRKRFKK